MGWKLENGEDTLGSIESFPGAITINENTENTSTVIKRIEAWDEERVLGFRRGLNRKDETELKYRIEDANTLAGRIKQAPLTRFNAEIVYQER